MKISVNPGDGKRYLGIHNTPDSPGYVVLTQQVRHNVVLRTLEPSSEHMPKKYLNQLLGPGMRKTMETEGMGEAMDWLKEAATGGRIPVHRVLEETTPAGQMGRLVELMCGDVVTTARQIVPSFDEEHPFSQDTFWGLPAEVFGPHVRGDEDFEDDLPCMGYADVAAHRRPTSEGSRRQALSLTRN